MRASLGRATCLIAIFLAACGGGESTFSFKAVNANPRAAASLSQSAPVLTPTALMDWAESEYPQYFPGHSQDQAFGPYTYRFYPSSLDYLGVSSDGGIYVLGPLTGGQLVRVAGLGDYTCRVYAQACTPTAVVRQIAPSQGPIAGGTVVTLTGSGFTGTTLKVDGVPIAPVSSSDTQIVFQTPAHDNGIASIQLTGHGPAAYAEFAYLPPELKSLPAGYITTVMGIGFFRGDGRLATKATLDLSEPGLAVAANGEIFMSEPNENVVRRLRIDGVLEAYAGTGAAGYAGDGGPALAASFGHPRGLAMDPAGNLLVTDTTLTNSIRRIDAGSRVISTIYGGPRAGFSGDGGPAVNAQFSSPLQLTFDGLGNLYVLDWGNVRIRKVDAQGVITSIAGNGTIGFSGDGGPATQATFNVGPEDFGGLAADSRGNVYLADTFNDRVRRIDGQSGTISTFLAGALHVTAVVTDHQDNVYVGFNVFDATSPSIVKLSPTGELLQSWGRGYGITADAAVAASAPMCLISRLALDVSGNVLVADSCSNRLQRIDVTTGLLATIAGSGAHMIGETGPALATVLSDPGADLLFLPGGDLLVAESGSYRIRRMDAAGNLTSFAGTGLAWGSPDGPALQTYMPASGLGSGPDGAVLVAEVNSGTASIDTAGNVHSLTDRNADDSHFAFAGDGGPALSAITDQPWDIAADVAGNILIADTNNNRIRRIDAQTGTITTVAGSGPGNGLEHYGGGSSCGDGGMATQACLNTPYGIAVASDGTMYIGENFQHIRKVTPDGIITTFFSGGGQRLRLSSSGNLFMTPYRIQPNGHAYQFTQLNVARSGLGDGGPASQASWGGPAQSAGIAVDAEGNLFFTDDSARRVRAIRFGAVMAEPGSSVTVSSGDAQTTSAGSPFPGVLQVTLRSPAGTLENGIRVDFVAPASGPSCSFPGGLLTYSALTDLDGKASVTCTANTQAGRYQVTATPLALTQSVSYSLENALH
jgi:trimeric autotransporter adhesin